MSFTSHIVVTLEHPLATVFPILGTNQGHNNVARLSPICTHSELLDKDFVAIPGDGKLEDAKFREAPATDPNIVDDTIRLLPRQFFTLTERVSILLGLKKDVVIEGTFTWDEAAKVALYESKTGSIIVRKLREFEEIEATVDGATVLKTKFTETINGTCPWLLQTIVQSNTVKAHKAQSDLYATLF